MLRIRTVGALVTITAAAAAVTAAAAGVSLTGASLAAGTSSVTACDVDGFSYSRTLNGTTIATLTVAGIHTNCVGGTMTLTIVGGGNAALATASGALTGTSRTFALTPQPLATSVTAYAVAVAGP